MGDNLKNNNAREINTYGKRFIDYLPMNECLGECGTNKAGTKVQLSYCNEPNTWCIFAVVNNGVCFVNVATNV